MARVVEVIYSESHAGRGTAEDPHRTIRQLWTKDGQLIAEQEPDIGLEPKRTRVHFIPIESHFD